MIESIIIIIITIVAVVIMIITTSGSRTVDLSQSKSPANQFHLTSLFVFSRKWHC